MTETEFDHDRFDQAYPPGIENTWWQVARSRVIARTFANHVPRTANVLEVGCGTGIVTTHLRGAGWNVSGVEIGSPKHAFLTGGHVRTGTNAVDLPLEERMKFDALALFDVIEHIADAPAFLRDLFNAFPNARQLIITVPARQELWTSFDDHFGHFRRYDRPMVREHFRQAGLAADHAAYFFHGIYPAIAINNALRGRKRNIRFTTPAQGAATAVNRGLGTLFALESRLLPGAIVGSSIIAVGHRE